MRTPRLSRGQRALLNCAPINQGKLTDRSMRSAVSRAADWPEFANQQNFDRTVAALATLIPVPPETAEWFAEKDLVVGSKWTWKKIVRNPAVLAISIAVVVIAGVSVFQVLSRLNDFPGSATARKLLTVAASTRPVMLDPVSTEAGTLSDLFFMKHGLEHYDVPEELPIFAPSVAAFSRMTSRVGLPKSGSPKNGCSCFFFRRSGIRKPARCCGFPD